MSYIKPGDYLHGCGQEVRIDSCADLWVGTGAYRVKLPPPGQARCPSCNRLLWIADLAPKGPGFPGGSRQGRLF